MTTKNNDLELIRYRIDGKGIGCHSKKVSKDEIINRRIIIRQILINTQFCNSSNDELDGMRVTKLSENCYLIEERNGYETILGYKNALSAATNNDKGK